MLSSVSWSKNGRQVTVLGRRLAIKLIRDEIADADVRTRFMQEARAGGGLKHPNVVTVFDAGDYQGHPFIAMEFVSGETLAEPIRRAQPIPLTTKLHLIEQLCRGLACAHRSGLVHRDIKPANVMVDDEGTLKILDFGIARVAESGLTSAGVAIGTVNYMSPEQVAGAAVDFRSDVFAVGAVFHELLSYQLAFPGTIHDGVMYRIVHGEPVSLTDACPDLDESITQTVERALRAKPDERYQDLDAMADELAAIRPGLDPVDPTASAAPAAERETRLTPAPGPHVRTPPPPSGTRAAKRPDLEPTVTSQRHTGPATGSRRLWRIAAAVAAALIAGVAILGPQRSGTPESEPDTPASAPSAAAAARVEPAPRPEPAEAGPADTEPVAPELSSPAPDPLVAAESPLAAISPAASDTPPPQADRLAELRQQAVDAFIQGDREASLGAAASVLQLAPDDAGAERVLDRLHQDAVEDARGARGAIDDPGRTSRFYEEARRAETDAEELLDAGRRESAIRRLWAASSLFQQAAATARREPEEPPGSDDPADAAPAPAAAPPPVTAASAPEDADVVAARGRGNRKRARPISSRAGAAGRRGARAGLPVGSARDDRGAAGVRSVCGGAGPPRHPGRRCGGDGPRRAVAHETSAIRDYRERRGSRGVPVAAT